MFERFTERARQVVVLAQEEARLLKHNYIGTEHILLGLLREDEGVAAEVLGSLGVTLERLRAQVVRIVGSGEEETSGQIPFTPRAKKVLELALREALSLGHNYISTEHLLLALQREDEGVAARILLEFDAGPEKVRNAVIRRLPGPQVSSSVGSAEAVVSGERMVRRGRYQAWLEGLEPVLDRLELEIRGTLGRDPDAGDLLLVLACASDMLTGQAVNELGIDLDALWGTIEHARKQANLQRVQTRRDRKQLADRIHELRLAKEQAIEARQFDRAAQLRDQERELAEERGRATATTPHENDVLQAIRRRLGIPDEHPAEPQPPPSSAG